MSDKPFVHLHLHTEYSLLDGATRINQMTSGDKLKKIDPKSVLFDACLNKNMPACAITDHGNMYGAYQFFKLANAAGVKPIIGCEFYMTDDMTVKSGEFKRDFNHLILLAKNNAGYKNLVKLNSLAFVDGFYYKPRIDFKTLKEHSEGLICLSACIAGQLPRLLREGDYEQARKIIKDYKEVFNDDYYIELQDHGIAEEIYVIPKLVRIAEEFNVELVATNDVHYLTEEDAEMHDILLCIQTGRYVDEPNRMRFEGTQFYLKDYDEMKMRFEQFPRALSNTLVIADKCNVTIDRKQLLPPYRPENGMTPFEFLKHLTQQGLLRRYGQVTPEIQARADYELNIVNMKGFVEYYLIVWDFINYARKNGIPVGPGRGSGAGSIIAYAIGITQVEPLRYDLYFERFLNPERKSMPDFDIDFCMDRRGEVIDYVINKYGKDRVSQIITFGTMAAKNAVKDVARALRMPFDEVNKITKLMPNGKISLSNILGLNEEHKEEAIPELVSMYNEDDSLKKVFDFAMAVEGMPRQTGMHAAGVVICSEDISDNIPLQRSGTDITTQFDKNEVEELGMLKMDFLGLRTLTDIEKTIKKVKQNTGETIDFSQCTYDDPEVFKLIASGDTNAVFQLESSGMQKMMKDLRPDSMEDIIAGIALYRPGPMQFIGDYIEGKHHPERITYLHPLLVPILKTTYGCMVYQEQIMAIFRQLAGYSFGQADIVRRAMGKKDMQKMIKQREIFIYGDMSDEVHPIEGALKKGVAIDAANALFDQMLKFAEYCFNKAHSAAYAYVTYQTAYLKLYHPVEYFAAVLDNRITNLDEIKKHIGFCLARDITVLPPDINKSGVGFETENGQIRYALAGIKGIGISGIENIIAERNKNGAFKGLQDFIKRVDSSVLNKRLVENLIKAGAFDSFGDTRLGMIKCYENMMDMENSFKKQRESGQLSLFDMGGGMDNKIKIDNSEEYKLKVKLLYEKEVLGMYITGNPLAEYKDEIKKYSFNTSLIDIDESMEDFEKDKIIETYENSKVKLFGMLTNVKTIITKKNQTMATARVEDLYGGLEITVFPKAYSANKEKLIEDEVVVVEGRLSLKDEKPKLLAETVELWEKNQQKSTQGEIAFAETINADTKLYLKLDDENKYDEVAGILHNYVGDIPVIIVVNQDRKKAPFVVRNTYGLTYELNALLGEENVKFVEKKK
jgi:DNA polymerase-3 subunit alpha